MENILSLLILSLFFSQVYFDVYAQNTYKNFALIVCGLLNLMGMGGAIMLNTDLVKRSGVWSGESKTIEGDIFAPIL